MTPSRAGNVAVQPGDAPIASPRSDPDTSTPSRAHSIRAPSCIYDRFIEANAIAR